MRGMRNNEGRLESKTENVKKIWTEHFQMLLYTNREYEQQQIELEPTVDDKRIKEPDKEEIIQ